jgi:hypothetical protein
MFMDCKKNWFYLAVACVVLSVWYFRYELIPLPVGDAVGPIYKLDRLTGSVSLIHKTVEMEVEKKK